MTSCTIKRAAGSRGGHGPAAVVIFAVGAALLVANVAGAPRVLRGEALGWAGAAICATALFLFTRAPQEAAPAQVQNPIPPSGASVQVGRALYQAYCATCHGEGGRGDGAQAASLPYPPFDLVQHVPLHPDAEVFRMITEGRPDRGMPPWGSALDDEEVWHLVNFLRAQAQEAGSIGSAAE